MQTKQDKKDKHTTHVCAKCLRKKISRCAKTAQADNESGKTHANPACDHLCIHQQATYQLAPNMRIIHHWGKPKK